jgi:hypothetical protein
METDEEGYNLREVLHERISLGNTLLTRLSDQYLRKVPGLAKLQKKIKQEIKFLEKFESDQNTRELRKEHLECSNLVHLQSTVDQVFRSREISALLQPFNLNRDGYKHKKICVDIVCDSGHTWVKVVARNPLALQLNSQGDNHFGQRSIVDQAREFVACSKQNVVLFRQPQVVFSFSSGVSKSLANVLKRQGISVEGEILELEDDFDASDPDTSSDEEEQEDEFDSEACSEVDNLENIKLDETRLNLDITAMIAYVSNLTNGRTNFDFKEKILSEQADWEQKSPVKPFLDQIFDNKALVCCESAKRDFDSIMQLVGGPMEQDRAALLSARISVVPDTKSDQFQKIDISGKIKERSCAIFGTGDALRLLTVTANSGFVRAAQGQGLNLAVILHESRALTESKEPKDEML